MRGGERRSGCGGGGRFMYVWRGRAGHSMTISNSAECWKNRTGARGQACGACACLITHTPPACLSAPLSTSSTLPTPPPAPPCRVTLVLHLPPHFSIFHPHSLSDPAFIPLLSCRVTPVHHTPHPFTLVPPPLLQGHPHPRVQGRKGGRGSGQAHG